MKFSTTVDMANRDQSMRAVTAAIIVQAYEDIKKFVLYHRRGTLPREGFSVFLSAVGYFESEEFDAHCSMIGMDADVLFQKVKYNFGKEIKELMNMWKRGEINEDTVWREG